MRTKVMLLLMLVAGLAVWAVGAKEKTMAEKTLEVGTKAPGFTAPSSTGKEISLDGLKGKIVVLYFYPKDDTPGCTKEACSFRDVNGELQKMGVVVLGVSKDSMKSHEKFIEKYRLNFPLISDPEGKIISAYGVWKEKSIFGKTALGVNRSTFLIGPDGVIRKIWRGVKVEGHDAQVLDAAKKLES